MLEDVWAEADALLAAPPPKRATAMPGDIGLPSVWDEADAILSTPPKKIAPAPMQSPAGADRGLLSRPAPIAARGVTDPTSVKVSAAPGVIGPPPPDRFEEALGIKDPLGPVARKAMREPLVPESFVTSGVDPTQAWAREGELNRGPLEAAARGAVTGIVEGGRQTVRALSSPLNLALIAAGVGERAVMTRIQAVAADIPLIQEALGAARQIGGAAEAANTAPLTAELTAATDRLLALENLRATVQAGQGMTGAAFTVEGAKQLVDAPTWSERAAAVGQMAGGAAMAITGARGAANPSSITEGLLERGRSATARPVTDVASTPPPANRPDLVAIGAEGAFNGTRPPPPVPPRAEPSVSINPDTLAEIERLLQEPPRAEAPPVVEPPVQQPPSVPAPPVAAGPGAPIPEAAAPSTSLTPATLAEVDQVLSQTSAPPVPDARRMEPADAGIRQEPIVATPPAGPLESGRVEERPVVDAGGTQPPGRGQASSGPLERRPSRAADARAAEADTLDTLITHARDHGFAGDETHLRGELQSRLDLVKELDAEYAESGRNPDTMLRDIARLGGLSVRNETGLQGELTWLKQFQDNVGGTATRPRTQFGQVRGVQGVFREGGLSVDDMLTSLQQDGRYTHIENVSDFLDELRAAATAEHEGAAVERLRQGLGERWWESMTPAQAADVLDTGETQTRLPGAEQSRQVGKADTSFRAPVQATSDDFAQSFLGEHDMPVEIEGDLFNDEPGSQGMPVKGGPPVPERPRNVPSRGFFGKQELPAKRPNTLPARRFGVKIRPLPVSEMVQKLTDLFGGVPVNVGRLYKGYLGVYQPGKESIRVQVAEDLHVIAHEMGHHLDMAIMEGSKVFNRGAIAEELKRVGAATSLPSYSAASKRREGTAEFFRRWLTDPDGLAAEAPKFTAAFEQYLERHPKIGKGLREIRNDVQRYVALPAEEQARLHIDFDGGGRQLLRKAQALARAAKTPEARRRALASLSTATVDDLAYLRYVEDSLRDGRPLDIAKSAYTWARLARGHAGKAEGFLAYGVRDVDGTFMGPSLDAAIGPVLDRLEDFAVYAAARRARTLHARGLESGFTESQIAAAIEKHQSPVFDQALKGIRAFHVAKLKYMVRGGVLSAKGAAKMLKLEPAYVPYWRVEDAVSSALTGKTIANRSTPVKRMKGGGRRIADPIQTIIRNTHAEVSTVEQNRAMGKFVQLALATQGHGVWLEEIAAPQVATRFKLSDLGDQIRSALEAHDVEIPDIPDMDEMLNELATVFTPRQFATGKDRIVTWLDGGKLRWFEIHDQDLYDALTAVGPQALGPAVKWFAIGARTLQKAAVSTVGFLIRNPIKDQFAATVQSRAGYRPGYDFLRGLFEYVKQGETFQLYLNSMADQATMVADDRDLLRKRLRDLGHGKLRQLVNHTVLGPFDGLGALSHAGESATRIGEFMRTIEGAEEGQSRETVLTQAALNARDVSQDFQRKSRFSRDWNNFTAFFAARVGGYGRVVEAFHENPTRFLWKALAAIALPSLLLWIVNHEDDEYNELPAWERNYYWHVPLRDLQGERTGFARIPKPFELGQIFGTATELALEFMLTKDPALANRLMDRRTAMQLIEQVIPTAVLPWVEIAANYDFFRDRAIVSPWQADLAPSLQYNRWTSETSKALGDLLDMSPAKIDTLFYGYTAGVGQGAMESIDTLVGSKKPAGGPGRWPGVGAIYRPLATSDAESFTEFFSARDALAGLKASVKEWHEMGRDDKAQRAVDRAKKLAPFEQTIPAAERQLKDFRDQVNQVFATPTLTPPQKRQALDRLYLQMLNIVRGAIGKKPIARRPPPPVPARPSAAAPVQ